MVKVEELEKDRRSLKEARRRELMYQAEHLAGEVWKRQEVAHLKVLERVVQEELGLQAMEAAQADVHHPDLIVLPSVVLAWERPIEGAG